MMKKEVMMLNEERNVSLTMYLLPTGGEFGNIPKRPAILILPGGGYHMCSDREAEPVAMPYLKAGYHVFILRYSLGANAVWPNSLNDYDQAMALIRANAEEWNIYADKIAVIGFSAGGHLAASAATMSVNRPNAAILGYPVINEENAHIWEKTAPDTVSAVDKHTCPCFVFATRTDTTVPVENSLQFVTALAANNISFESHIYAYGPHGFSTADDSVLTPGTHICNRAPHWVSDSIEWLKDMFGTFGNCAMTKPAIGKYANGNSDDYLSVDCTMGYLMRNEQAGAMLGAMMAQMGQNEEQKQQGTTTDEKEAHADMASSMSPEAMQMMMNNMVLRDMLKFGNVPEEVVEQLDAQLKCIPNV